MQSHRLNLCFLFLTAIFVGWHSIALAQTTKGKDSLTILSNEYTEFNSQEGTRFQKLVHDVAVKHGKDTLLCDSAYFFVDQNSIEAFGNARVFQGNGTATFADYMRYTGNNKIAYLKGNAAVSSGEDNLWAPEIEYNLNTEIGRYRNGGTLQSKTTTITSDNGNYNAKTKDARFTGNVHVDDPDYQATSTDMGYNTETELVTFFGPSVVVNENSILRTSSGTWDAKNKIAKFNDRPNITDDAYYIEADHIDYDKNTGWAFARGNVIAIDSANNRTLYSEYTRYNEKSEKLWAYGDPIMKMIQDSSDVYVRAEIFFAEPEANLRRYDSLSAQDSLQATLDALNKAAQDGLLADSSLLDSVNLHQDRTDVLSTDSLNIISSTQKDTANTKLSSVSIDTLAVSIKDTSNVVDSVKIKVSTSVKDTLQNNEDSLGEKKKIDSLLRSPMLLDVKPVRQSNTDTSKPKYFVAYYHVLVFSDSMQGRCDSLSYLQTDSLLRLFKNPVIWSGHRQMIGDTILVKMDSNNVKEVYVPKNGNMTSRSGPEKAEMFDQIQGNKMWAFFTNNKVDSVIAEPNAATIYYATDEQDAYIGASEVTSDKVGVYFDADSTGEQRVKQIVYTKGVQPKMTPMQDVNPKNLRLSRFKWLIDQRPKSLDDFLNEPYTNQFSDSLNRIAGFLSADSSSKIDSVKTDAQKTDSLKNDSLKINENDTLLNNKNQNSKLPSRSVESVRQAAATSKSKNKPKLIEANHKNEDEVMPPPFEELLKQRKDKLEQENNVPDEEK